MTGRAGESLPPADFDAALREGPRPDPSRADRAATRFRICCIPQVFRTSPRTQQTIPIRACCRRPSSSMGRNPGEEIGVDIEEGKTLIIKFLTVSEPHADGTRTVFFELNGQPRDVSVVDRSLQPAATSNEGRPGQSRSIGAAMPGMVVTRRSQGGDKVTKGQKLFTVEAMKMETTITARWKAASPKCWSKPAAGSKRAICCCGWNGAASAPSSSKSTPRPSL